MLRCLFAHDWGSWEQVGWIGRGCVLVEKRRCTRCGHHQVRNVQGGAVAPVRVSV